MYYPDRLVKFRSTGQINLTQGQKLSHNCMQRIERHREKSPNSTRMLTWNKGAKISNVSPLNFVDEYIESRNSKKTDSYAQNIPERDKSVCNKTVIPNYDRYSPPKHAGTQDIDYSSSEESSGNKKKDFLTRVDTLYKSRSSKEKKRRL